MSRKAQLKSSDPKSPKTELSLLFRTVRETAGGQAKDTAASIAFWGFFSIFPLLIGILSLTGYYLESDELRSRVYEVISDMLPGSAGLVNENLEAVVRHRGTMSLIGIGGLLWTAGKGFGAITRAVNRAIGAKRPHSFVLSKFRYFFMALAVSILMMTSIGITVAIELVLNPSFLSQFGLDAIDISRFEGWAASFVLVFAIFALIYKLTPYVEVTWSQVLPGALLGAAAFELGKAGFVVYLDRIAHFEEIYGSLSSIIVLLLWLYLSSVMLVFGARYNIARARAKTAANDQTSSGLPT